MINLIQKFLLKQSDTDKILKLIQRKVLKGTHLPVEIKEIQARYLNCFHFKDIYLYLLQNKLPTSKATIRKIETLAEMYILLDSCCLKSHQRMKQWFLQFQKHAPIRL